MKKKVSFTVFVFIAAVFTAANVYADFGEDLGRIIVTATRIGQNDYKVAGNVTVIGRKQIKDSNAQNIPDILKEASKTSAVIMLLISASMSMSWIMSFENIPQNLSDFLLTLSDNKIIIL